MPETETAQPADETERSPSRRKAKLLILVALVCAAGFVTWQYGHLISLDSLAAQQSALKAYQQDHPVLVFALAGLVYTAVTGLSLPGAAALTLVYGWYFGFWPALIIVSFASTAGATLAFLSSRYLLRDSVQDKFGERLELFNEHLEKDGAFYLFTLRLIPAVPFFVINLVMGLTPLKATTYWWVSQLGMLPGTAVYVYAGSRVPDLTVLAEKGARAVFEPSQLIQISIAFAILGLFPLVIRKVMSRWGKVEVPETNES